MEIENRSLSDTDLRGLSEGHLVSIEFVQQGAIHAISTLLKIGCSAENAHAILASLQDNADRIRGEISRRGKVVCFPENQNVATSHLQ